MAMRAHKASAKGCGTATKREVGSFVIFAALSVAMNDADMVLGSVLMGGSSAMMGIAMTAGIIRKHAGGN